MIGSRRSSISIGQGHDSCSRDNNMRRVFFGPRGTLLEPGRLKRLQRFTHVALDYRDRRTSDKSSLASVSI